MAFVVVLLVFAAWTHWMYVGRPSTRSGALAVLIGIFAALAAYDGTVLAIREYGRAQHGRVKTGTVVAKLSSTGADDSPIVRSPRRRRYRPILTTEGFKVHDLLARLILTGSTNAWVIEYRYGCERPYGCRGRDFVREDLWRQLSAGATVNVRQSNEETTSSRLDENPQWGVALLDVTIGGALLLLAGALSGRLRTPRRRRYVTAPAVVTAIEPVKYGDALRWRIRFAYFDPQGAAQEGSDEVQTDTWEQGDACLAVFPPEQPDLASLRAVGGA